MITRFPFLFKGSRKKNYFFSILKKDTLFEMQKLQKLSETS